MEQWYERPLDQRAKKGGEWGVTGKFYRAGEIMPFYVPRYAMPQINEQDYPELLKFSEKIPVHVKEYYLDPHRLKPHQRIDRMIVHGVTENQDLLKKKVLVSSDLYILDGNHRWWAHESLNTLVPTIIFDLPFEQAIAFLFSFPKTYTYGDGLHKAFQN